MLASPRANATLDPHLAVVLDDHGFVVLPGPFSTKELERLQAAYAAACATAAPEDIGVGRASTRVSDFENQGPVFDLVYTWPAVLVAARRVVGGPSGGISTHSAATACVRSSGGTAARVAVWFVGGIALALGMALTASALMRTWRTPWNRWWAAGLVFVAIELVTHLALRLAGRPSLFDDRG